MVSDPALEALQLIAANKPDRDVSDTLTRNGMAAAEAQYVAGAARLRYEDLVRQSQARLAGEESPFSVAQQLATDANLPPDLAEQIVAQAHVRKQNVHKAQRTAKLQGRAKVPAAIIGVVVFIIVLIADHGQRSGPAEIIGFIAGGLVYLLVLGLLRANDSRKRKI